MAPSTRSKGKKPATPAKAAQSRRPRKTKVVKKPKPQGKTSRIEVAFRSRGLSKIKMIDSDIEIEDKLGNFCEEWSPRLDHVYSRVAKLVSTRANSMMKAFVYLQHELNDTLEVVPVAIVVLCKNEPTLSIVKADLQTAMEETERFDNNGLSWLSVDHSLSLLVESGGHPNPSQGALMNLRRPSEMDSEPPQHIGAFGIEYGTKNYVWQPDYETLSELLEIEECPVEDKEAVMVLLQEEQQRLETEAVAKVQNNQAKFGAMVTQIAEKNAGMDDVQVRNNLEDMKVYKIFPTGLPQPESTVFGPTGGFRYELTVNRFQQANKYFTE